ncbi:MAG TPA: hypothetical protein PK655_01945 [archaeon]|jgi:hypothetical protein|nr:hypothetical protein [archaeon]HPV66197.1 hypothetical protein [archaeon]HRS43038.1 hypothetical protein [Candidatus Diapherotrites archaeon]
MRNMGSLSKLFAKFSTKILNLEDKQGENPIATLLVYKPIFIHSSDLTDFLQKLRLKHLINDIIITDTDGIVIGSTNKDIKEGFKSAALYNYINSEIKDLSIILIEANGWQIIFKNEEKVYFIKANDELSRLEVLTIVKEIENFIKCIV